MKGLLFFKPLAVFSLPLDILYMQPVYFVSLFVRLLIYFWLPILKPKRKLCWCLVQYACQVAFCSCYLLVIWEWITVMMILVTSCWFELASLLNVMYAWLLHQVSSVIFEKYFDKDAKMKGFANSWKHDSGWVHWIIYLDHSGCSCTYKISSTSKENFLRIRLRALRGLGKR